ncbi:hypothetical protein A0J57_17630 [Sphingobium sp. 22B]|nr:hypothetical protein A0J57_17630 [Sphingobium sp. 22B]OAP30499.1 hypothetical protein A8O16_17915 [Sphingobium sp. 20006FA]
MLLIIVDGAQASDAGRRITGLHWAVKPIIFISREIIFGISNGCELTISRIGRVRFCTLKCRSIACLNLLQATDFVIDISRYSVGTGAI